MSDATASDQNVVELNPKHMRPGGDAKRVCKIEFHDRLHLGMDLRPDGTGAVYRSVDGKVRSIEVPNAGTGALVLSALYHEILCSKAHEQFYDDRLLWDWDTAHGQYMEMMESFAPWMNILQDEGIEPFDSQHDLNAAIERHQRRQRLVRQGLAKPLW